jgi:hypothetical protein
VHEHQKSLWITSWPVFLCLGIQWLRWIHVASSLEIYCLKRLWSEWNDSQHFGSSTT